MIRLIILFLLTKANFLNAQQFSLELDTILFTNLELSAKQSSNFHMDVHDEYLYSTYYNAEVHGDVLSISKYNLDNYTKDSFQLEIRGLAEEILKSNKWNTDGIRSFNIISKDTFLIGLSHKFVIATKDNPVKYSKKIDQLNECLLYDGNIIIIDYNISNYDSFQESNLLDTLSFYIMNDGVPKLIYNHPFIFSEAISIQPNHFWDINKDKILLTDVNGSISYLDSKFNLLHRYHSEDKIPVKDQKLLQIRKKHKGYIMVMRKLSEILWSSNKQFTRDIHFLNDSTFFVYKKWLNSQKENQQFKIAFYRIKNGEIFLLTKMNETSKVTRLDEIYKKENFPTNFSEATKILTSNNKIIKLSRFGVNRYPFGFSFQDYNDLRLSELVKGNKFKTQIQIFNVLEKY